MENLYIVGTAGSARDCANYAMDAGFQVAAFVERNDCIKESNLMIRDILIPVVSEATFLASLCSGNKQNVLIPIGMPAVMERVWQKYKDICEFPNLIHPSAIIADTSVELGCGNIIGPNCVITTHVSMGNFNYMNIGVTIGHDVVMGSFNVFNPKAAISGCVSVGDGNTFGVNSSVLQGLKIGNHNTLGMNSALVKDAADNGMYLGVPARQIS